LRTTCSMFFAVIINHMSGIVVASNTTTAVFK
jgi:hypothetical protein